MSEAISKFSGLAKEDIYFWFRDSIPKMTQQTQEMRNLSASENDPIDSGGAAYLGADEKAGPKKAELQILPKAPKR